ncbi:MAG: Ig-like domain-containing protein, partial [Verrucomicrobiales bacterium]|nr:Ig-like domain-containing protein [Verrucomicrobiales bacterium]
MKTKKAGILRVLPALALVGLPAVLQLHAQSVNLLAYWDFNDASNPDVAFDQVYALPGFVVSGAAYGADGSGASGAAGDRAMDFGTTSAGQRVTVTDAPWFDIAVKSATDQDKLTVTFWQKLHAVASTSSVWFQSPASSGTQRGFQSHVPWGNNNIYFDTAGCCDAHTMRVNADASTFAGYYDGFFLDYHHFALVKDGTEKRYYIDGLLFMTDTGANAFPSDFVQLAIGASFDASNSLQGMIDEFAVFAGALSETDIMALAGGASPDELAGIGTIPPVGPPAITSNPQSATVMVGDSVAFSVTVGDGAFPGPAFQWTKNGENIPGAVGPDYMIDRAVAADDGAEFACVVSNAGGSGTSAVATLTVNADTTDPVLADAWGNVGFNRVTVMFSEPVDPATAEVAGNYQLSGGVTVTSATLAAPSGTSGDHLVILETSAQPVGTELTLTVNNVQDLQGNTVAAGSQWTFTTFTYLPDAVSWERWNGAISMANIYALVTDPNHRAPDVTWMTSIFESGRNLADNYGARGYAWFTPATTGDYEFLVTSDDNSRALLSTDADPANILGIAAESGYSSARAWAEASNSEQYSYTGYPYWTDPLGIVPFSAWGQITLNANQKYFLEVIWQEGGGGDGAELTIIKSGDA